MARNWIESGFSKKVWTKPFFSRTETKEESLATSLLARIDPQNVTKDELTEAFCRDVDAYSFEFQVENIARN